MQFPLVFPVEGPVEAVLIYRPMLPSIHTHTTFMFTSIMGRTDPVLSLLCKELTVPRLLSNLSFDHGRSEDVSFRMGAIPNLSPHVSLVELSELMIILIW